MPSENSSTWSAGTPVASMTAPTASIFEPENRTAPFSTGAPATGTTRRAFTIQAPAASWAAARVPANASSTAVQVPIAHLISAASRLDRLSAQPDPGGAGPGAERGPLAGEQRRDLLGLDRPELLLEPESPRGVNGHGRERLDLGHAAPDPEGGAERKARGPHRGVSRGEERHRDAGPGED